MKKIIIVTNGTLPIPSVKGGAVETLLNNFIDMNEKTNDFSLTIFSLYDKEAKRLSAKYKNVAFIYIHNESFTYKIERMFRYLLNKFTFVPNQFLSKVLKYKCKFKNTDLIVVENNPYFLPFLRKITNKPIVLHLHNDYLTTNNYKKANSILSCTNHVICVSRYIQKQVKKVITSNCTINYIHNGIDISLFDRNIDHESLKRIRDKYNFKTDDIIAVFVGRLQESKGVKLLIQVFNKIPDNLNIKLLIVGSTGFKGSKKNSFLKEIEILSKEKPDRITFSGYIDYNELPMLYKTADFAICPSLAVEAFSLVCIEAQASSLPIIITKVGGMPETVTPLSSISIDLDEKIEENLLSAILSLALDQNLRKRMSVAAKQNANKYSSEIYFEEFSKELKSLI
jgi:glycosyltransferase involved in cell wall biosynthesis